MKIKSKLLFLILALIASILLSVSIFAGLQININKLERELGYLRNLDEALRNQLYETSSFFHEGALFKMQLEQFDKALDMQRSAMEDVSEIKALRSLGDRINNSLIAIGNLAELQNTSLMQFRENTVQLIDYARKAMVISRDFTFEDADSQLVAKSEYKEDFRQYVNSAKTILRGLLGNLEASINTLSTQYSIIYEEIENLKRISYMVSSAMILLFLLIALFFSVRISKMIVLSISGIEDNISKMAEGDLTGKFNELTNDEIGSLSSVMNGFQSDLRQTIKVMKDLSGQSTDMKGSLIATSTETSASAEQIAATLKSIDGQMKSLDENISLSSDEVMGISSLVGGLNNQIFEQMSMVEESTASVTEMIASLKSVSDLTKKNDMVISELVETIGKGGDNVRDTAGIIEDINSSVNEIYSMVDIIQKIASQTNLLAMNAAIEAAHAGENGKGFAVVADEIRKLAEASAVNSKDITANLKGIIEKIDKASQAGRVSDESFQLIDDRVNRFREATSTISSSAAELDMGGRQILEAMTELSTLSTSIREKSETITENSRSAERNIGNVTEISNLVVNAVSEVNTGFNEVTGAVSGLQEVSDSMGMVSDKIDSEVNRFITETHTAGD